MTNNSYILENSAVALSSPGAGAVEFISAAMRSSARAYIDDTGIHVPEYSAVLEDLRGVYRAIYGDDIYLEADSQDGALLAALALRIHNCHLLCQSVYSAYAPSTAQGAGLSSVVKVNGLRRATSSHSQAQLRVVAQPGTIINNGVVTDRQNNRWLLPAQVTMPLDGEIAVTATAEEAGDIRAAAGEIDIIATPIRGWQSASNPIAATPGAPVETDAALRRRQTISTALPSLSIFDGTQGAVASLPGVTRSRAYENDRNEPDEHGIPAHSICLVVEGGDTGAIGKTIAVKKGPGCGTYGDVAVSIRDKYNSPATIRFFRPGIDNAGVFIQLQPLEGYVASTGQTLRQNVADYVNAMRIGESILLSKLYTPINSAEPDLTRRTFDVLEVRIGLRGGELKAANLEVAFNHAVACALADVELREF